MTTARTYLDWNATSPLLPAARAAMIDALDVAGNPSSVHAEGRAARALVESARESVAALVAARPEDVVFTSGATEANTTVLAGGWDTVFYSPAEHDSVLATACTRISRSIALPIATNGIVDVAAMADHGLHGALPLGRAILTLHLANNETGVLQPVAAAAALARAHGIAIHTDAVQAAGRIPIAVDDLDIDYLTLSSHKLGGPKGIGAIVARNGAPLLPLVTGGGQERRRRSGTENVAAIAGFGAAARHARASLSSQAPIATRRDRLERDLRSLYPTMQVIGATAPRLANTSCLALPGHAAETLVIKYDLAGIAVSAGAACSSGKMATSHVLAAMNLPPDLVRAAIRISIGPATTDNDIAAFLAASRSILRSPALAA